LNISFRQALKEDLPQILIIEKESFEEPWSEEIFNIMLRSSNKSSHIFYICEEENKIIGYIIWEKEYFYEKKENLLYIIGHILNFCVIPEERRKGYGKKIIKFGLKKMIEDQLNYCYLEVRVHNISARHLYESIGMKYASKLPNYYPNEDGLVYIKELRQYNKKSS